MPRGDGTGPSGKGPLGQGRRCSSRDQGLLNSSSGGSFYTGTPLNNADDFEQQARQLEKQAEELRTKAKKYRETSTGGIIRDY